MSGGSYDYAYYRIEELADAIWARSTDPKRRAFSDLLRACAKAAHAIEWVDSGDYGDGDEMTAIDEALTFNAPAVMVAELTRQVTELEERAKQVRAYLVALEAQEGTNP